MKPKNHLCRCFPFRQVEDSCAIDPLNIAEFIGAKLGLEVPLVIHGDAEWRFA
tara:strand:- start:315 stop:473 length:159 start_codon:yes stop_codon:yes gene_type:complete